MATKPKTENAAEAHAPTPKEIHDRDEAFYNERFWVPPTLAQAQAMDLSRSLANARAEFGEIRRTKEGQIQNRKYMYADHADVLNAVIDVLAKYEVEIAHEVVYRAIPLSNENGRVFDAYFMFLKVAAIKGEEERNLEWPIGPIDAKNQTNGANLTYAKRYAISTLLNLAPDDDTDGVSPDEGHDDRSRGRNNNRGRDYDRDHDYGRRSNFDNDVRQDDPDAWRSEYEGNGNGRNGGGRERRDDDRGAVRSEQVRRGPDNGEKEDRSYLVAIDSLNSAGNRRSCEQFWQIFKKDTKLDKNDKRYQEVADVYRRRWKILKEEEDRQKDPLGAGEQRQERRQEEARKPEPDVKVEEDHVSPDQAIDKLTTLLENAGSIAEYHQILQDHQKMIDAAMQFPPDAELIKDMKEVTEARLLESEAKTTKLTERMEDVEDQNRSENSRPNIGSERL